MSTQKSMEAARDLRAASFEEDPEGRASVYAREILRAASEKILMHLPYLSPALFHLRLADAAELVSGNRKTREEEAAGQAKVQTSVQTSVRKQTGDAAAGGTMPAVRRAVRPVSFGTDGTVLYYDPYYLMKIHRAEPGILARDYLHVLLHGIFRHPYLAEKERFFDRTRWNLACDIAVEALITSFHAQAFSAEREKRQKAMIALLSEEIGEPLTAQRIYAFLRRHPFTEEELMEERLHFLGDAHRLWGVGKSYVFSPDAEEEAEWEDAARETESLIREMEEESGSELFAQLIKGRERKITYAELLRTFFMRKEILHPAEEFDYIYYTYGLSLYGNMPLIEPLEYAEEEKLRTIVIAVDTSGSVQGKTVRAFLRETLKILFSRELFSAEREIHILQCDDRVREDVRIRDAADLEAYTARLQILGKGETDFRPVFDYVEEKLAQGEWKEVQGLLYYTDGLGYFPEKMPSYETAFILSREAAGVPAWALSYVLDEKELI